MAGCSWTFSNANATPGTPNVDSSFEESTPSGLNNNIQSIISFLDSPAGGSEGTSDNQISATQPLSILKDVVAYVEVRTTHENYSRPVEKQLRRLGAVISEKFSANVTHVIFGGGRRSTVEKARKKNLHLVSVLWVDSCKKAEAHVPEAGFPALIQEQTKGSCGLLKGRLKKAKSMQPRDFEEELARSTEREMKKRRKKELLAGKCNILNSPASPLCTPGMKTPVEGSGAKKYRFYVAETQPRSPDDYSPPPKIVIPETPPSMRETMQRIISYREKLKDPNYIPHSDSEDDSTTDPISRQLFNGGHNESDGSPTRLPTARRRVSISPETQPPEICSEIGTPETLPSKDSSCVQEKPAETKKLVRQTSSKRKLLAMDQQPTEELVIASKTSGASQSKTKLYEPNQKRKRGRQASNSSSGNDSSMEKPTRKSKRLSLQITSTDISGLQVVGDSADVHVRSKKDRRRSDMPVPCRTSEKSQVSESRTVANGEVTQGVAAVDVSTASSDKTRKKKTVAAKDVDTTQELPSISELEDSKTDVGEGYSTAFSILNQPTNTTLLNLTKSRRSTLEFRPSQFDKQSRTVKVPSTSLPVSKANLKAKMKSQSGSNPSKRSCSGNQSGGSPSSDKYIEDVEEKKSGDSQRSLAGLASTLVSTSLHNDEQDTVRAVVKKFGGFEYAENVTSATTHLICGSERRTLNVLRAIARGCWLVSFEWILKSVEAGHFLPEESYELAAMFPGAKARRLEKEKTDQNSNLQLFADQGIIYVAEKCRPPQKELLSLLKLSGGKVTTTARKAHICVGRQVKAITNCVTEQWLLGKSTNALI